MPMKKIALYLMLCCLPLALTAQYEKMLETMDDEEELLENGKLVLRFINAENGRPVDAAMIRIDGIGEFTTDLLGKIYIELPEDDTYGLEFSKEGFITAVYPFEVIAGTLFSNRFSVSPVIEMGALRVVLDWGRHPKDLDAHLIKEGDYHISYQDMHDARDGIARLDRDDLKGFGPETITMRNVDEKATYTYFVRNFSDRRSPNSKTLSKSNATVRVYGDNRMMNSWSVPADQNGTTWMVFTIEGGKIKEVNEVGNQY